MGEVEYVHFDVNETLDKLKELGFDKIDKQANALGVSVPSWSRYKKESRLPITIATKLSTMLLAGKSLKEEESKYQKICNHVANIRLYFYKELDDSLLERNRLRFYGVANEIINFLSKLTGATTVQIAQDFTYMLSQAAITYDEFLPKIWVDDTLRKTYANVLKTELDNITSNNTLSKNRVDYLVAVLNIKE